ncbi:MAG TPA: nucleotidyltransferase domain-containing protein [Caldithrix abyssi]|uniref:Nucleotidyltransferase domain-containing protein n=1 Tax=Caldithrix abyssi TaxID=187145 RepID=A0A7V4U372_CALAY|nr:nucleotidyltransferase domain-containing protein [Caldithrix abyssi]
MPAGYRDRIIKIIREIIPDPQLKIILYGSRARGDAHATSDFDIAIDLSEKIPARFISRIKEKLENSDIPYKVDIVDLNGISEELKQRIIREGKLW